MLESLLQEFAGTLFLVSHDRAFLENTVTQVIAFEGNGVLTEFGGGYDDWNRYTQQRLQDTRNSDKRAADANQISKTKTSTTQVKTSTKLNFKEQKELDSIPPQIEELETEQKDINSQLADSSLYQSDDTAKSDQVKKLQARLIVIETSLEALLARWEQLDAISSK